MKEAELRQLSDEEISLKILHQTMKEEGYKVTDEVDDLAYVIVKAMVLFHKFKIEHK